jgi:hypothetical protein
MKHWLYSRLVKLFPRDWQVRFKDEFLAVLETQTLTPRNIVDVLQAAIDAHLKPQSWSRVSQLEQVRNAQLTLFWTFALFAFAVLYLFKQSEHYFDILTAHHPEINLMSTVVGIGWGIACFVCLMAITPMIGQGLRAALKQHSQVWLYIVSGFLLAGFVAFTVTLLTTFRHSVVIHFYLRRFWQTDLVITVASSMIMLTLALRRSPVAPKLLKRLHSRIYFLKVSMVALTLMTLAWGVRIWQVSVSAFHTDHFQRIFFSTVLVMVVLTCFSLLRQPFGSEKIPVRSRV